MNSEEEQVIINTLRCIICDKVNNPEVQNLPGAFMGDHNYPNYFYPDPKHKDAVICLECKASIDEVRYEYDLMDEWNELKTLFSV